MGQKMIAGRCRMCLRQRMIAHSHILPKFLWKRSGIIGAGKKYDLVSSSHPHLSRRYLQDGIKEHLCCLKCEGKMNHWETIATTILFGKTSPFAHLQPHAGGYLIGGIDYPTFKLFQMSMLWKMGESSDPFFSFVQRTLSEHKEQLRRYLVAERPSDYWRYGCTAAILTHAGELIRGCFAQPRVRRVGGLSQYFLIAAGVALEYYVSNRNLVDLPRARFINDAEPWFVDCREIESYPHLRMEINDLRNKP